MPLINILFITWPFLILGEGTKQTSKIDKSLFVCYGKLDPSTIRGYDLVVLESAQFNANDIRVFKENNEKVLAYVSLTEVNENSFLFDALKPYCFGKNTVWGSKFINITDKRARQIVLKHIDRIEQKGFDGLFMDNLDNVSIWGKLKEKEEDLILLLRSIRHEYPRFYLCQNSGLSLDEEVLQISDAVVVESLVTNYDFQNNKYTLRENQAKKEILSNIRAIQRIVDKPIYILEYADDSKMRTTVTKELLRYGFPFYITQINLQLPSKFLKLSK